MTLWLELYTKQYAMIKYIYPVSEIGHRVKFKVIFEVVVNSGTEVIL